MLCHYLDVNMTVINYFRIAYQWLRLLYCYWAGAADKQPMNAKIGSGSVRKFNGDFIFVFQNFSVMLFEICILEGPEYMYCTYIFTCPLGYR